jgi:outer membrane protein assembly factor BamE
MVDKLQVGMTKPQVQFILGTPLIVDTFNPTRWDYYYTKVDSSDKKYEQQLNLTFDPNNTLLNIESDLLKSDEKK